MLEKSTTEEKTDLSKDAETSKEILAFPNEIAKDMAWSPEADMLMQINETLSELNNAAISIANSVNAIRELFVQAAELAGEHIAKMDAK